MITFILVTFGLCENSMFNSVVIFVSTQTVEMHNITEIKKLISCI